MVLCRICQSQLQIAAKLGYPLNLLLWIEKKWPWTKQFEVAFQKGKEMVTLYSHIMIHFDNKACL